jgi:hypothetical protein
MLAYPLAMAVALAYFAEHYIVDAVAGHGNLMCAVLQ